MTHKHAFEYLDRTLRDMFSKHGNINCEMPFRGKIIVTDGDFRQILLVIPSSTMQEIVIRFCVHHTFAVCANYLN